MSNQELFSQEGAYLVPVSVDFRHQTIGDISPTLTANGKWPSANNTPYVMATGQGNAEILTGQSRALTCNHEAPIVFDNLQITSAQNRSKCDPGDPSPTMTKASQITVAFDSGTVNKPNNRSSYEPGGASPALLAGGSPCVAISDPTIFQPRFARNGHGKPSDVASALTSGAGATGDSQQCVTNGYTVRRITPVEAERLQGFTDRYTDIPGAADGPRYKALGNSMAVPVMRWVGERIKLVDEILKSNQ